MRTLLGLIREPDHSHELIGYLIELSKDLDLSLHLLYIENPANHELGTPNLTGTAVANLRQSLEARIEEGKRKLIKILSQMRPLLNGKTGVDISSDIGNEVRIAEDMIASGKIQMVAIENRKTAGFWWQDTLVKDMVRNLECPLWVIPEHSEYQSIQRIIYATDYHEEDIPTLQKLIDLTHRLFPHILALHINKNADFEVRVKTAGFQKMLETKTTYKNISAKTLIENKGQDLVQLIHSYAAMNRTDLIVLLKENMNFLERIFNRSSVEKIMEATSVPVLVYHSKT